MKSPIADIAAAGGGTTKENPIVVAIAIADASLLSGYNGSGTDTLHKLYDAIPSGKYVAYDLSGCTFTSIGNIDYNTVNARTNRAYLASIALPDALTSIGDAAFNNCTGLTSVAIPHSVTSIGEGAFANCSGLTSVIIGNSVTSIGNGAFYDCIGLESVTIGNSVTSIGNDAFSGCIGLTSVTIPNSVTSIGDQAFYQTGLTSVTIPSSVTSIGEGAFANCTNLSAIQVGTSNTAYTAIEGVLFNKAGTELIAYPAGKGGSPYTIPDGVTSIGAVAFSGCIGLTSVTIPDSVTSIGNGAFFGCSDLKSVYVLRDTTGSLTTLGSDAFRNTNASLRIYVPESVVDAYKGMDNWSGLTDKIQAGTPSTP